MTGVARGRPGVRRQGGIRAYLALSRTPHAVLDMAAPAAAALAWLDRLPPLATCVVGLATVFAGYTAVYALNDLVDSRTDAREAPGGVREGDGYLDAALPRHPIALGLLGREQALAWVLAWGLVAAVGSFALNPLCLAIFVGGCALEVAYCRLCGVTPWRAAVSGVVKTLGALAAVLAVDRQPDPLRLALLFLWLFFWEIGGQNVPADWADVDRDRSLGARTIPVTLGERPAGLLVLGSLAASVVLSVVLAMTAPGRWRMGCAGASLAIGAVVLLAPAVRLANAPGRERAIALFNRASWYPPAMLAALALRTLAP